MKIRILFLAVFLLLRHGAGAAATDFNNREEVHQLFAGWNAPFRPFRVIGNIYYVGASGISSWLITTPQGHILIDSGFAETVPLICSNVTRLGFEVREVKFLLSSHAHIDHVGGHARLREATGAKIVMSTADAALLESGGRTDFLFTNAVMHFESALADRLVGEGDQIELGGTRLTCHLTPGHTKGCTTWTMEVGDGSRTRSVVFFGSTSINPGTRLVGNEKYPEIARDLKASYRKLKELPCDVFLAPHGSFFGLERKAAQLERGADRNPFIDSNAFKVFIEDAEGKFLRQLRTEEGPGSR